MVEVGFGDDRSRGRAEAGAVGGGEHGTAGGYGWREGGEADGHGQVVIDGFHAALVEVGFVPEAGTSRIAQEIFPPLAVGVGAGPFDERIGIAPVLAHADVYGKKGEEEKLVAQQAFGFGVSRLADLRAHAEEDFDSCQVIDAHSKVDDHKIGVGREIDGAAGDFYGGSTHGGTSLGQFDGWHRGFVWRRRWKRWRVGECQWRVAQWRPPTKKR